MLRTIDKELSKKERIYPAEVFKMHRPTVESYAMHKVPYLRANKTLFDKYRSQLRALAAGHQLLGYPGKGDIGKYKGRQNS